VHFIVLRQSSRVAIVWSLSRLNFVCYLTVRELCLKELPLVTGWESLLRRQLAESKQEQAYTEVS
jgi:hypothetical protein